MSFQDKAVLVTGGTRGIGAAIVSAFLDDGAYVAVNGRTRQSADRALARLNAGERAIAAPGDVAAVAGCESAVGAALDAFGRLDILVNSAGVFFERSVADSDEALWDATIDVNLKGSFFCSRAALPALRTRHGCIVNIGSESGMMGNRNCAVYCASKAGVVNMTRAMAIDLAPEVRVNAVCPGPVDTDMLRTGAPPDMAIEDYLSYLDGYAPMKRICTPEEVAQAVLYLASDAARFVTGAALAIDGGTTAGR